MKKLFLFTILLIIIYANPNKYTIKNNTIIGLYEPTKRKCAKLKSYNGYCTEAIRQFEFIKGEQFSGSKEDKLEFVIWSPRLSRKKTPINNIILVGNEVFEISPLDETIKPNKTIILKDLKEDKYISKIQFLDSTQGIYTFGFKNNLSTIHFKRITKEEDKYLKHYRKKK